MGYLGIVGNISLFFGSILYQKVFRNVEYRYILAFTNIIVFIGALIGLAMVLEINRMIGISDF